MTAFEAFSKSAQASQGHQFLTNDGRHCDITALQAARKAEWDQLSPDQQEQYEDVTAAMEAEKAMGVNLEDVEFGSQTQPEQVACVPDVIYRVRCTFTKSFTAMPQTLLPTSINS